MAALPKPNRKITASEFKKKLIENELRSHRSSFVSIPKTSRIAEDTQIYCYEFTSQDLEKFEFNCQAIPLSPMTRPPEISDSDVHCY